MDIRQLNKTLIEILDEDVKPLKEHIETIDDVESYIKNHTVISIEYKFKTGKVVNIEILPLELNRGLYGQNYTYLVSVG